MSTCSNPICKGDCDAEDGQRCVHEACPECGNSIASIGDQIYQAFQDGFAAGRKRPRRRKTTRTKVSP